MRKYLLLLVVPLLILASCTEDTSAYLPQDKQNVKVDDPTTDNETPVTPSPEDLLPGMHIVDLDVLAPDGVVSKRRFKYYLPYTINKSKPISLIFEFHGSTTRPSGVEDGDLYLLSKYDEENPFAALAMRENCIAIFPAAFNGDILNWQNAPRDNAFVTAILEYLKSKKPLYDIDRVYATGQSSGAIYSFRLTVDMPNVFAAMGPRSGQLSLRGITVTGGRATPIIAFNGIDDVTVLHEAAVTNMIAFTETIGGYFANDMVYDDIPKEIAGYKSYLMRSWLNGKADFRMVSIIGQDHSIPAYAVIPMMWEFFNSHPRVLSEPNYFSVSNTNIVAEEGYSINVSLSYSSGATITLDGAPAEWSPVIIGNTLKMTAPGNFFSCKNRKGEFRIRADKGAFSKTITVKYMLNAPKQYFEIGDIYYNTLGEAVGVVFWVDDDIRKAKIIGLQDCNTRTGSITAVASKTGNLGADFQTPDRNDGEGNTLAIIEKNKTLRTPSTATNSAFVWAYNYSDKGVTGWYMPAINECAEVAKNWSIINQKFIELGADRVTGPEIYSSTVVNQPEGKYYYYYDLTNNIEKTWLAKYTNEAILTVPRAVKKVSKL